MANEKCQITNGKCSDPVATARGSDTSAPNDLSRHRLGHQSMQTPLDRAPINVREERLDVLRPIRRFVIKYERMLPNVHHQHRIETGDIARLVQADPMIRQLSVCRVLVTDGPTN